MIEVCSEYLMNCSQKNILTFRKNENAIYIRNNIYVCGACASVYDVCVCGALTKRTEFKPRPVFPPNSP